MTGRRDSPRGLHVAIIPDGNGRWAAAQGLPRSAGHRAGAENVTSIVAAAPAIGIETLTLYGLSADNWKRPASEVTALMEVMEDHFRNQINEWVARGVRVSVMGRRDRLSSSLVEAIAAAERETAQGETLHLRIAVDYSARAMLVRAACRLYTSLEVSEEGFSKILTRLTRATVSCSDVDLLIRTGGEQRLSDFLLWECAYAELYFTRRTWPEFTAANLAEAIHEFEARKRTFGQVPELAES
jgi:undecaprenyl diphosphate synthase